jgi:hypothetical protein
MKNIFSLFSLSLFISFCAYAQGGIDPKPNVIVIMTDDQGYPCTNGASTIHPVNGL